jgi:hypothetical protein
VVRARSLHQQEFISSKVEQIASDVHAENIKREITARQKIVADLERKKTQLMLMAEDVGYSPELGQRMNEGVERSTDDRQGPYPATGH